jgi:phage baseplate assembly protein W
MQMPSDTTLDLRGLLRPFRRDRKADFAVGSGEALIRSAVGQILGTVAASEFTPGELPWNTTFGSHLHILRHQRNDALLQELARIHVVDALKRWEPRIRISSVQINRERDRGENVLAIRLRYSIVARGSAAGGVIVENVDQTIVAPPAGADADRVSGGVVACGRGGT